MARLIDQSPVLLVRDVPKSITYWRDCLGFGANTFGDPPVFAILRRDTCHMMLADAPADHEIVPYWKIRENTWNAYFWVDDARAFFEEFKAKGAIIDYEPYKAPYGVLEFGVQDLDGHDIAFGQELE